MKEFEAGTKIVLNVNYKRKHCGKEVILEKDCSKATLDGMAREYFEECFGPISSLEMPKKIEMNFPKGHKKKFPNPLPEWFVANGTTITKPKPNWRWDVVE